MASNQRRTTRVSTGAGSVEGATVEATKPSPPKRSEGGKRSADTLNIGELNEMSIAKLIQVAKDLDVDGASLMLLQ